MIMDMKEHLKFYIDLTQTFWGNEKLTAAQAIGAMKSYHQAKSKEGYIEACKMIPEDYEEHEMAMIHIDYLHAMLMVSAAFGKEGEG